MAYHYVGGMRDQLFLLPISMRDWLSEGHLAWWVIEVVERIDTGGLHLLHPNDGPGRPAYDPDMMLTLLLYAYLTGQRSSRRIEAACRTDAAYRVICGDVVPDHATIARFLIDHEHVMADVFVQVLRLCATAGLVTVGTVAIDGTKIGSDAALDRNHSGDWIRRRIETILAEAVETDADEHTQPGLGDIDQLPVELAAPTGRLARLEAALAVIEAQDAAAAEQAEQRTARARAEAAQGRKLPGRKPKDPHAALARAEADEAAVRLRTHTAARAPCTCDRPSSCAAIETNPKVQRAVAATATARLAAKAATPTTRANITDAESRIMKTATGWVQGYNAQAAVNEHQIIVAAEVSQDAGDVSLYQPMVTTTRQMLDAAGIDTEIGLVLGDAGYWSEDNATAHGPARLIATTKDWKQRRAARELGTTQGDPPDDATPLEAMEHRLRTPEGAAAYAKRSHTVEPIFAVKANHGYHRFRRRGLQPARSEWALIATVHNLGKLHRATR
ncbi:MAG: DDE transposase [Nitriliruptor sp.]|nr:MAG: DDE transposase [Nitriliruptor sp.]